MKLSSPAFKNGGVIPSKYTCDGNDICPPLEISQIPANAESLALVMDDPDASMGTFDHWIVWNIPKETTSIQEGKEPPGTQGKTHFGRLGYGGPCPPSGTHNYRFKVYALNKKLDLKQGSGKKELENAMRGCIVEETSLVAGYKRR